MYASTCMDELIRLFFSLRWMWIGSKENVLKIFFCNQRIKREKEMLKCY